MSGLLVAAPPQAQFHRLLFRAGLLRGVGGQGGGESVWKVGKGVQHEDQVLGGRKESLIVKGQSLQSRGACI